MCFQSARFKVWGNLPGDEWQGGAPKATAVDPDPSGLQLAHGGGLEIVDPRVGTGFSAQLGGSAVSANGLNWTDYRRFQETSDSAKVKQTLRFDAAASLYYDRRTEKYVGTMRAFRPCPTCGGCPIWWQPHGGCQGDVAKHKDDCSAAQCNRTVRAIGVSFSSGDDFQTTKWGPNDEVQADHEDPTRQFYSQVCFITVSPRFHHVSRMFCSRSMAQVSWPFYNIYLGIVMVFSAVDPPEREHKQSSRCCMCDL